jgi:hypothetical protein
MSVPTFPDATAQEKFMLMLLERVDAVTEELHTVKKELADARTQLVAPLPSMTIENIRMHSSQWFMKVYTSDDTPLAKDVFARRVLKVLPRGTVHIMTRKLLSGHDLLEAYVKPGNCVNLVVTLNAIHEAIYADHAPLSSYRLLDFDVVCLDRIVDANCTLYDFIKKQKVMTGLDHGTCYRLSADSGDVREEPVTQTALSSNDRYFQREKLISGFM